MSPLAERLFEDLKYTIADQVAPTDSLMDELNIANAEGNVAEAERIAGELASAFALKRELHAAEDTITPILRNYEREDTDFPFQISPLPSTHEEEVLQAAEEVIRTGKPWKYIDDARPLTIKLLLDRDENGQFLVNHLTEIRALILQEQYQDDPDALLDAKEHIHGTKRDFVKGVAKAAEETGGQTMAEILEAKWGPNLEGVSHESWSEVYEIIKTNFGDLSPDEFTDKVLMRFLPNWLNRPQTKPETQKVVRKKEPIFELGKIKIADIKAEPQSETILAQKLLRNGVLKRIENELLGGTSLNELMDIENIEVALEASSERIGQLRDFRELTKKEANKGHDIIWATINRFQKPRTGWHHLPDELVGFRAIYEIMGQIREDKDKVRKLVSLLYPTLEVTMDRSGYIVGVSKS